MPLNQAFEPLEVKMSVYERTSENEVLDLLQGGQGVFGIALGRVWREVERELAELPAVPIDSD